MICCASMGYCYIFDVYQGKTRNNQNRKDAKNVDVQNEEIVGTLVQDDNESCDRLSDTKTGPSALIRCCKSWISDSYRIVFCDRFYTSVTPFLKLYNMGIFCCGTIMTNRLEFIDLVKIDNSRKSQLICGNLLLGAHKTKGKNLEVKDI